MAFVPSLALGSRPALAGDVTHQHRPTCLPSSSASSSSSSSSSSRRVAAVKMAAASDADVPDMGKRTTMNLLLGGAVATVTGGILVPFASFFVPKSGGGGAGGVIAKDALGNNVKKNEYLSTHNVGSHELVQGLRGDATYLIVNEEKDLEFFALNAVCTHLGCVVPWNAAENKFKCPCHGSQYDPTGAVVRGPAPLPLALEHVETDESDNVVLKSWKETDFRTKEAPWWNF